ncbi:arginase [Flavobacterium pallidum]|uniref:Arginase n=1 Tax=Flavobacterium pallidum TaxID=2172098 RepID=A0A2S1SL35_9FLAO|nr:arginase [Flavobacterium pallidum]AWI27123.1 arginase [Flavobacterium pallidum]
MHEKITFLLNQSEITAGTRGASLGPDAIMTAARNANSFLFSENEVKRLPNMNHLLDKPAVCPLAKNIEGVISVYNELNKAVPQIISEGAFPFIIAADHGSAGGTIAAIKTAFPEKRLGVLWIDAHADIHTPYTTPTGNMHGMPLAIALHTDNMECKVNDVDAQTISKWEMLKSIGGNHPKVQPEDMMYIAVRDTEEQEDCIIRELNIQNIAVAELRVKGIDEIIAIVNAKFTDCDMVYVSFDVDSMDPELSSHGTGTPVENGLTPEEAKAIMQAMASHTKLVCMEVVEVNPCLDEKKNRMAEIAFDLIASTCDVLKNK